MNSPSFISDLKKDLPASIVVFFVALPLCLGIALASGAPLFSGIISGIVGGIIVGIISGSRVGVSGPAAGLAAIVLTSIATLGDYRLFLTAVVIGGIIQLIFGFLRAGIIAYYFPTSVIRGMLSGIGIIIILKQIPHFFGYDDDPEGDFAFKQIDGESTFSEILKSLEYITPGSLLIGLIGLAILLLWEMVLSRKGSFFQMIQGPLVAVVFGIIFVGFTPESSLFFIQTSHLVSIPVPESFDSFIAQFSFPDFSAVFNPEIWVIGFTIALVASLETLLCVEATDKLDPDRNVTPTNRELFAQGTGNIVSGLIGGLPITQVIVRSSANIQSGARSKKSAIIHGFLLLVTVIAIPFLLNMIPLSVLAAILFIVGFKLAKPSLFIQMYRNGWKQFVPFIVTILGIIFTDLLRGIGLGLAIGIIIILIKSYQNSHFLHKEDRSNGAPKVRMQLAEEVTFINKGAILKELESLEEDSYLELDLRQNRYLDSDIIEILEDFAWKAKSRNIHIKIISEHLVQENPESYIDFFEDIRMKQLERSRKAQS
jgi:MFS superfamily sulfate permease-like transporter